MQTGTITDRKQIINTHVNGILDFYKAPLTKALQLLQAKGVTITEIKREVFDDQISKQAIQQNYIKSGGVK